MGINITVDDDAFYKALADELKDTRDCFENDLKEEMPNIFIYGDAVKDKALIRAHIDALNLLIAWYDCHDTTCRV